MVMYFPHSYFFFNNDLVTFFQDSIHHFVWLNAYKLIYWDVLLNIGIVICTLTVWWNAQHWHTFVGTGGLLELLPLLISMILAQLRYLISYKWLTILLLLVCVCIYVWVTYTSTQSVLQLYFSHWLLFILGAICILYEYND